MLQRNAITLRFNGIKTNFAQLWMGHKKGPFYGQCLYVQLGKYYKFNFSIQ
jgi:hypothetical protein